MLALIARDYRRLLNRKDFGELCKIGRDNQAMKRKITPARRPKHSQDELRELILSAATALIEEGGLDALSAREVARRIGYSPGTLYNVFKDRDEIVLTIESRLLDGLAAHLDGIKRQNGPREQVMALADAYLDFTRANPNLWKILFVHSLGNSVDPPDWYQEKIDTLLMRLEDALRPAGDDGELATPSLNARVLWASVHGITSLPVAGKLNGLTNEAMHKLVETLVATYLDGLGGNCPPATVSKTPKAARKP